MMREAIADIFSADDEIQVVAEAGNGVEALEAVRRYHPDVVTLDVAMPVMDGITALKNIMIKEPRSTVMLSSLTQEGARMAFDALRYGAVDFISKPSALRDCDLNQQADEIRSKIRSAAAVEVGAIRYIRNVKTKNKAGVMAAEGRCHRVVAMGAAEGGYGALLKIIPFLPANLPFSYLVTLYVARDQLQAFAGYLNDNSAIQVKCASHEESVSPGVCYLSCGNDYLSVHKQDGNYSLHLTPAPFASRKGSLDMLLFSTADVVGENSVGVVLSGAGTDGAEGLEEIIHRGGAAIVQDPKSCLAKGMANAALARCRPETFADIDIASVIAQMSVTSEAKPGRQAGGFFS